jgi:large conductance mechanosensitive channel
MSRHISGFLDFIRERGVAGLAIGFILGGAAQGLVKAFMEDIINPILAYVGGVQTLADWAVGPFKIGDFISVFINFLILCLVVYFFFKMLQLEKLDKQKE